MKSSRMVITQRNEIIFFAKFATTWSSWATETNKQTIFTCSSSIESIGLISPNKKPVRHHGQLCFTHSVLVKSASVQAAKLPRDLFFQAKYNVLEEYSHKISEIHYQAVMEPNTLWLRGVYSNHCAAADLINARIKQLTQFDPHVAQRRITLFRQHCVVSNTKHWMIFVRRTSCLQLIRI